MPAVDVKHVTKSFANKVAVDDLSFAVEPGEVLGVIGPNGAGKTTTIRMMMDMIKPDAGEIAVLGGPMGEAIKNRVGYLPEERGLYKRLTVMETIVYLASLKGLQASAARQEGRRLLAMTGMAASAGSKIGELSKGMGQIIQFIVTLVHDPAILILDEPFSALDPVNNALLKGMITDLRGRGKAVILSTHQMNEVEELCDRVLMIDHGRAVLYGTLAEVKARYRTDAVVVECDGGLPTLPGVRERRARRGGLELLLESGTAPGDVLQRLVASGASIRRFEVAMPTLNDIFLQVAGHHDGQDAPDLSA